MHFSMNNTPKFDQIGHSKVFKFTLKLTKNQIIYKLICISIIPVVKSYVFLQKIQKFFYNIQFFNGIKIATFCKISIVINIIVVLPKCSAFRTWHFIATSSNYETLTINDDCTDLAR